MRGRKPKSQELKILEGSRHQRRRNGSETGPKGAIPKCPRWLSAEAKAKWKSLAPELHRLGRLTSLDGEMLAAYCSAWGQLVWAEGVIAKEGMTTDTNAGGVKAHPAVTLRSQAWKALQQLGGLFGLSPLDNERLPSPEPTLKVMSRPRDKG